ncbi:MAG: hypothetical protein SGARI_008054, partial [Bacillariaceae sp.]
MNIENYVIDEEDSDEDEDYDIEAGQERQGRESTKKPKKKKKRSKSKSSKKSVHDDEPKGKKKKKRSSLPKMVDVSLEDNSDSTDPTSSGRTSYHLSKRDDPFAKREGKTLLWSNINMTLKAQSNKNGTMGEEKKLLADVFGEVPHGQTTAIM